MTNNGDSPNKKSATKKQAPPPHPRLNDGENASVVATSESSTSRPPPRPRQEGGPRLIRQPVEPKKAPLLPPPGFPSPRSYATGSGSSGVGSTNVTAKGRGSSTSPNSGHRNKQPQDFKAPLSLPPGFPFPRSHATGGGARDTESPNVFETGGSSKSATHKPKGEGGPKLKQPVDSKTPLPPPPGFPFPRSYATGGGARGAGSSNMTATGRSSKAPTPKSRQEGGIRLIRKHGFPFPRARGGSARGAGSSHPHAFAAGGGGGILIGGSSRGSSGIGMTSEPPRPLKRKREVFPPSGLKPICSVCGKSFVSWKSLFGHLRAHPERQWRGCFPPPGEEQPAPEQNNQQQRPCAGAEAADGGNQLRADNLDIDLNQPQVGDFGASTQDETKKDDIGDGGFDLNKPPKPDDENAS